MNDEFVCFGTFNKNIDRCLVKCPDRERCERWKEMRYEKLKYEREHKNAEDNEDKVLS